MMAWTYGSRRPLRIGVDVCVHPLGCAPLILLFLVYKPPAEQVRKYSRPEGRGDADVQAGEGWPWARIRCLMVTGFPTRTGQLRAPSSCRIDQLMS